jgi:hypothetical protein
VPSPQVEHLKNVIAAAQQGSEAAVAFLRTVAKDLIDAAPIPDLVTIGQCLVSIGVEAGRIETGRN